MDTDTAPRDTSDAGRKTADERELETLAGAVIGLSAQRTFLAKGYVRLDGLWSPALADALEAEARAKHPLAVLPDARPGPIDAHSGNRSPARQVALDQAPLLSALHIALTRIARVVSAKMVVPSVGTFGYYEHDDGCYLHLDTDAADITFLICVVGELGALHMHPELIGAEPQQLATLEADTAWDRHCGELITYPRNGVAAIRGRVLPHHRPGSPVSDLTAVAAIHYRSLF